MNSIPSPRPVSRRDALKWMASALALPLLRGAVQGSPSAPVAAAGYGVDADLLNGATAVTWARTFTPEQRETVTALCDVIIPADERSPSASAVGVPDFLDEWVSAPYPDQVADKALLLPGLAWIDHESHRRFQQRFHLLTRAQQHAICDDICHVGKAGPGFERGARFFKRFRDLTAGGYYTTPAGHKEIGYVGNTPLAEFAGPPRAALERLGLV